MGILKNKKGIALITVLLLLVVVGVLTSALIVMYTSNISRAGNSAERNRAFYSAEAGANYLNDHINKNAKEKNIVFQPIMEGELRNITGDLTTEFFDEFDSLNSEDFDDPIFQFSLADDLKINGFDLSFSFDETVLNRVDEIYGFIIEASNGKINEKIRLTYQIKTLPPYFRSSRQANKITIEDDPRFKDTSFTSSPAHSFATAEMFYEEWKDDIIYSEEDRVYYEGNNYEANENYDFENCNNPDSSNCWNFIGKGPDIREYDELHDINGEAGQYDAVDYGMDVLPPQPPEVSWNSGDNYSEEDTVSNIIDGEEKYFISDVDNPQTEPGVDEGWESEWQEYYNYKKQVVEIFDGLIEDYDGKVYSDSVPEYDVYNSSVSYNIGDIVLKDNKIKQLQEKSFFIWTWEEWVTIDDPDNPELAYEKFLNDNLSGRGPYLKIDGDFNAEFYNSQDFSNMNTDENGVIHLLIDGDVNINTDRNINFSGNENVIIYVNGDLNFNKGRITIGGMSGQLAYFAPNATFTYDNISSTPGSSMIVNELIYKNTNVNEVFYDTEDSPLIGKMNPEIAELSRSFSTQHGGGTVSQINPVRQLWEQIK